MPCELRGWHPGKKCDHNDCVGARKKNYITSENFQPVEENEGADRRVVRRHAALGTGLVLDGPELRGRERSELYESRESEENL